MWRKCFISGNANYECLLNILHSALRVLSQVALLKHWDACKLCEFMFYKKAGRIQKG